LYKNNLLVFLKSSIGEFHAIAPILWRIKSNRNDLTIVFCFKNNVLLEKVRKDPIYCHILHDLGKVIVGRKAILQYSYRIRYNSALLFTCLGGITRDARISASIITKSIIVGHPHAMALYPSSARLGKQWKTHPYNNIKNLTNEVIKEYDRILLFSEEDKDFYALKGARKSKIILTGYAGYEPNWIRHLFTIYDKHHTGLHSWVPGNYNRVIFIALRGIHSTTLPISQYKKLTDVISEYVSAHLETYFIVKKHPRQEEDEFTKELSNRPNVIFLDYNTFILSRMSKITISFYSTAITDSLAVGIPSILLHVYTEDQTTLYHDSRGSLISYFEGLGFSPRCEEIDSLTMLVDRYIDDIALRERSLKQFSSFFLKHEFDYVSEIDRLFNYLRHVSIVKRTQKKFYLFKYFVLASFSKIASTLRRFG
jgi:hypothetical protein